MKLRCRQCQSEFPKELLVKTRKEVNQFRKLAKAAPLTIGLRCPDCGTENDIVIKPFSKRINSE